MNKISLPDHGICTGCGACAVSCPSSAVYMKQDKMDVYYPEIDQDCCVRCGKCQRVCHLNNNIILQKSDLVYAAYSSDAKERATSASGGMAAELYKYARKNNWHTYGVEFVHNSCAHYKELVTDDDYQKAKNSKYVFCDAADVYKLISEQLAKGDFVLFVGIPCQVAALISFLGGRRENLVTVDIICHGTCPSCYLDAHIDAIEKKKSHKADELSFRDPEYSTYTYTFTLRDNGNVFYQARPDETDIYQIGYHKGLIYKESCYHCKYTRPERVGDLTLSDFSGLGKLAPYNDTKKSVSCVVVSSEKGERIFRDLNEQGLIVSDKRPADEAFQYDMMFWHPTTAHKKRVKFKHIYTKTGSFENAAKVALRFELVRNGIMTVLHVKEIRGWASKIKHSLLH